MKIIFWVSQKEILIFDQFCPFLRYISKITFTTFILITFCMEIKVLMIYQFKFLRYLFWLSHNISVLLSGTPGMYLNKSKSE